MDTQSRFEGHAIVELMGHQQLAGFVQQVEMGSTVMLRVDVPECPAGESRWQPAIPAFTKFVSPNAIYAITPCSKETAEAAVVQFRPRPIQNLELTAPALPAPDPVEEDEDAIAGDDGRPF